MRLINKVISLFLFLWFDFIVDGILYERVVIRKSLKIVGVLLFNEVCR